MSQYLRLKISMTHSLGVFVLLVFSALVAVTSTDALAVCTRIMPLGDSITAGYTDNAAWTVPFTFGYRGGLYTRLTSAGYNFQFVGGSLEPWNGLSGLPKTVVGPDLRVLNQDFHRGYGGTRIEFLNENIVNWLNADDPDVVLLMAGINMITQGQTSEPTVAESEISTLVGKIFTTKPDCALILATPTPYVNYTRSMVLYNTYLAETLVPHYQSLGKQITLVDQYANFVTPEGGILPGMHSNGINHPSQAAYDLMAETWFQGIQEVVQAPEPSSIAMLVGLALAVAAYACRWRPLQRNQSQIASDE